jgi:molybdenum cofactor cytidylyltransferase
VNSLGALLLAAGGSSRLGQSKQLLEINGEPLVRRQASMLLALNPVCLVVVTGADQEAVDQALHGLAVKQVHNPEWQKGMGSSLACGIAAMPERVRGALLLLCDQWKITGDDVLALTQEWQQKPTAAVTAQWTDESGQPASGPPVVFPRALFSKLIKLRGDHGAHQLLRRYKGGVQRIALPHAAFDIDQQSDLP